ncbi:MAG: signal peptidase I [bacterium]|nr:signal peptidase I [bacterium]
MNQHKTNRAVFDLLQQQLSANKNAVFRVISGSMAPLIRIGDRVVIKSTKSVSLSSGDIILYLNGNSFCTHRFVTITTKGEEQKLVTRGDRFRAFDAPVDQEKYLGKVISILRENIKIDLDQKKYCFFNKAMGTLFARQWAIMKAGERFSHLFFAHSNQLTQLGKKVIQLIFYFLISSIRYSLIRIKFAEKNEIN